MTDEQKIPIKSDSDHLKRISPQRQITAPIAFGIRLRKPLHYSTPHAKPSGTATSHMRYTLAAILLYKKLKASLKGGHNENRKSSLDVMVWQHTI